MAEEIAGLLDQCSQEELANILQAIESTTSFVGGTSGVSQVGTDAFAAVQPTAPMMPMPPPAPPQQAGATTSAAVQPAVPMVPVPPPAPAQQAPAPRPAPTNSMIARPPPAANHGGVNNGAAPLAPVPPAGRPASGGGRRPPPRVAKKADENPTANAAPSPQGPAASIPLDDLKALLQEHSEGVLSEVRKMLPPAGGGGASVGGAGSGETIDMGLLAEALLERDREVQQLEARLADLQSQLSVKDKRVAELGGELDQTVREVRHRQLDLELQQLKLEERVRANTDLEQAQRNLSARVEEAALNARHAALDLDLSRTAPHAIRAQGALPWTLRKNRLPAVLGAAPESNAPSS